jgi:hypothetical protein
MPEGDFSRTPAFFVDKKIFWGLKILSGRFLQNRELKMHSYILEETPIVYDS